MTVENVVRHKYVAGTTCLIPTQTKEERIALKGEYDRYVFMEIDTTDQSQHEFVLNVYKKHNLDCVSQRVGEGYHYWGSIANYSIWRSAWTEMKPMNPKWSPLTLRITKKFPREVFQAPQYHTNRGDPEKWARTLMYFLMKEIRGENPSNHWEAMNKVNLGKYFKCLVYPPKERDDQK